MVKAHTVTITLKPHSPENSNISTQTESLCCCNLRIFLHDEKNIRSGLRFAAGRHLNIYHQIQSEVVFFCQSITLNILSPIIALCTGQVDVRQD